MSEKNRIDVRKDGKSVSKYNSTCVPRVGEFLELDIIHEKRTGIFEVVNVIHRVFKQTSTNSEHVVIEIKKTQKASQLFKDWYYPMETKE
ncbi:hypothetical protein [Bacillus sp. JJ722]|uniref:hypothetical protein n=1 Tax=Bacillus sp. JJ722 TaxID=3122973 RepID=UPI002FFEFD1A